MISYTTATTSTLFSLLVIFSAIVSSSSSAVLHQQHRNQPQFPNVPPQPGPSVNINIISLGGDPTGTFDSTAAFVKAFLLVANQTKSTTPYPVPKDDGAGGLTVDLAGGIYLISSPLIIAGNESNLFKQFTIAHGTFLASSSFPKDRFLLEVQQSQGMSIVDVIFDSNYTGGGVKMLDTLQSVVTRCFFLHYTTIGMWGLGNNGHELMIDSSTFAEFMWGEIGYNNTSLQSGTGIWLDMPDSNVYNTIIRCTKVGIVNRGGGNLFNGVHIYASCNKNPDGDNVSPALISDGFMTRTTNCYFDDSPVIVTMLYDHLLTSNVFYGLSALIFAPQSTNIPARGLIMTLNGFRSTGYAIPTIHYDTTNGTVNGSALLGVIVADNYFDEATAELSTRVSITLAVSGTTTSSAGGWSQSVDLRPYLLFAPFSSEKMEEEEEEVEEMVRTRSEWQASLEYVNGILRTRNEPLLGSWREREGGSRSEVMANEVGVGGRRKKSVLGNKQQQQQQQRRRPLAVATQAPDPFSGAFQQYVGSMSILSAPSMSIPLLVHAPSSSSSTAYGNWGVFPTSTPGVISVFADINGESNSGNWSGLLHLKFDQALVSAAIG